MDPRLYEIARTGDINSLYHLLGDEPLILEAAGLEGGDTPLHVSVLAGKLDFICEIMKRRPSFAKELNRDGLTPLHIASAKGSLELVRELLKWEPYELCLLKGRERRIPLHYAAIKGRVEVLKELVSTCESSIEEVTTRGETALHLAVKNNQFEALMMFVEHLDDRNKRSILNRADLEGNTILHLAVAAKQHEVVSFLLTGNSSHKEFVDVNIVNRRGLTPLDILSVFPTEAGDRQIGDFLTRAGASGREHCQSNVQLVEEIHLTPQVQPVEKIAATTPDVKGQKRIPESEKESRDWIKRTSNGLMTVAILTAAVAYEAGVNPPGGFWQERDSLDTAGSSIWSHIYPVSYSVFLLVNTTTLVSALSIILLLISGLPLHQRIYMWIMMVIMWISVTCLIFTYIITITSIVPENDFKAVSITTGAVIFLWLVVIFTLLLGHTGRLLIKPIRELRRKRMKSLNSATLDTAV